MSVPGVTLVCGPGRPGETPNREGSSGLGAVEKGEGAFRYPPHTLLTAAAELRRHGVDVTVVDAVHQGLSLTETVERVISRSPSVIGVFVSWASRAADSDLLDALERRLGGSAALVAFGVSAALLADELPSADYVLQGEPELALAQLANRIADGGSFGKRLIAAHELLPDAYDAADRLIDIDALPFPAWDLAEGCAYPFLSVLSSRGCREQCDWCPYVVAQGHTLRTITPDRAVAELVELTQRYHPRRVVFRDPAFASDRERVTAICRAIIAHPDLEPGQNLMWECESHPSHLVGLVALMSLAGCVGVKVGVETLDPAFLAQHGRTGDPRAYRHDVETLVRQCRRAGVASRLYVMVGIQGQSKTACERTAEFVKRVAPSELTIKQYKRFPGVDVECGVDAEAIEQRAILERVRYELAQAPQRRASRWRRVLRRLAYRVTGGAI